MSIKQSIKQKLASLESVGQKVSWSRIKEVAALVWLNAKVQGIDFVEYMRVLYRYYWRMPFVKIDAYLVASYLCYNPFHISKRFLLKRGDKEIYAYGETPLTTLEKIATECRLTKSDVVFELGCGRGRTCFWLRTFIGCRVVGVEQIPEFITRANHIVSKFHVEGVEFRQEDMLQTDLTGATAIYLYGTCLEKPFIEKLIKKFERLPAGTKIITISFPLQEYADKLSFETMKRFPVQFNWGTTDAYLQIKK